MKQRVTISGYTWSGCHIGKLRILSVYLDADQLNVVSKHSSYLLLTDSEATKLEQSVEVDVPRQLPVCHYVIANQFTVSPELMSFSIDSEADLSESERKNCLYRNPYSDQKERVENVLRSARLNVYHPVYDWYWGTAYGFQQQGSKADLLPHVVINNYNIDCPEVVEDVLANNKAKVYALWTQPETRVDAFEYYFYKGLKKARDYIFEQANAGKLTSDEVGMVLDELGIGREPAVETFTSAVTEKLDDLKTNVSATTYEIAHDPKVQSSALATLGLFAVGVTAVAIFKLGQVYERMP